MHVMGSVSPANEREAFSFEEDIVAAVVPSSPSSPAPSKFCDVTGNNTPPALPPPPPPPPPPPFPGPGEPGVRNQKKRRVRSFFWKTIPEDQVKGRPNLWTRGREQQYQIDIQTIEELFGQSDCQSETKATLSQGGKNRSSLRETKEEVSILDSKRGMNIGIFLKQFKKSTQMIIDDVCNGNSEPYGAEPLRELLKLLPDPEEVKKLKAYTGDVSKLSMADSFLYQLVLLPSYSVRIESMLLKEEFPGACEAMTRDIATLRCATEGDTTSHPVVHAGIFGLDAPELMCCDELHAVLHLVLQAGNILNAGGYAGNAVGFKLSSLLALADTKANKPGMNLLHFVALEAQKKDEKLLEFPLKLPHIQSASRISLETLDAELQWITGRTHSVEESVQRDTELLQQLDSFLQSATASLCSLRQSRQQLKKEGSELIDFFCEDRDTFKLDDCFSIFHMFCSRFSNAVKENIEREAKEAAYRRRLQQVEEQKRHSWAGGEEMSGAFRLHWSSETNIAQHGKAGLLMRPLPHSPPSNSQSPPGHGGSLRRSRKSPSNSPSIAAERDLSMFLEMGAHNRKAAQQRGGGETGTALSLAPYEFEFGSPRLSPQTRTQSSKFTVYDFPQNQHPQVGQVASQTTSPKTSWSLKNTNSHKTTTSYLSYDATQTPVHATNNEDTVKPTSESNQQCDHNNNGNDQLHLGFITLSDHQSPSGLRSEPTITNKDGLDYERRPSASGTMSVVLETCTLVPELKVFEKVPQTRHNKGNRSHLDEILITDLEGGLDGSTGQTVPNYSSFGKAEEPDTSLSQREEDKEQAEKVVVWCVTGVCKAAEELTHAGNTSTQAEKDQCRCDNQGGNQPISSVAGIFKPSEAEPANEKPVPVPISSQPVPVSRCDDLSPHASSPGWSSTQPESAEEVPAFSTDASDEGGQIRKGEEAEASANEKEHVETLKEQIQNNAASSSCHMSTENTESTNKKVELSISSKPSTKNLRKSTAMKPTTTNATSSVNKSKPIRTLTSSESQGMRRVVPISRTGRNIPSMGKSLESTTPASVNKGSFRQRPSTAPSSRRSSVCKTPDLKDSKDQKVSGSLASPRPQNQEFQRRQSIQKASKPKPQPEEKMCRSTLRALTLAGDGSGGRGSISAPVTPMHKGTTHPSSPLPGFARNTASSSFRRTSTILTPTGPPHSESSPKASPKNTPSSTAPKPGTSRPISRTGSLRVSTTSRSDVVNPSSSLKRSQSIRVRPNSPLQSTMTSPNGHQRNDTCSFSDKSTHSRDSGKTARPTWR